MGRRTSIPEGEYLAGLSDALKRLQESVDGMVSGSAQGLADTALYVLGEAAPRAPVDTGDLRGSGYVELDGQPFAHGDASGAALAVGGVPEEATRAEIGFASRYAADQHEQVAYDHPRGGEAKYLESVLVEEGERILHLIAAGAEEGMDNA